MEMVFDAAAFWKILAIFIFVVLALLAVSLLVDSYVRFMEWKIDREERFKEDLTKIIVDSVYNKPYTEIVEESNDSGGVENEGNANQGAGSDL